MFRSKDILQNLLSFLFILQELLFASAKNIKIDLFQSVDHQKLSCHISSLQIDNQLHNTPYPVVLSFNREYRSSQVGQIKDDVAKFKAERGLLISSDSSFEPVFNLAVAKWRKKDISLVSFEYISLRCRFRVKCILVIV